MIENVAVGRASKNGKSADQRVLTKSANQRIAEKDFAAENFAAHLTTRGIAVRLFLTCWLVFSIHFATNTVREIYPALSLADDRTFDVSAYEGLHPDIFAMENRGAFINNNPGASMMGALPYTFFRPVTDRIVSRVQQARAENPSPEHPKFDTIYPLAREFYQNARARGYDVKFGLAAAIMQSFVMAPMSALSVVVMFTVLLTLTAKRRAALALALVYGFATPVFYRTAQLNQNLLLAHFAFFSFVLLWRCGKPNKNPFYALAGLCAGWTLALDYSGAVAVAVLSFYAVYRWSSIDAANRRIADLIKFAAGASVGVFVLLLYQYACFGNPFYPAQSYMPPANFTDLGYRGFSFPRADLLLETAFSMRFGLFTSAPILLLAFLAPVWMRKKNRLTARPELIFIVAFAALFFIFCAANQYGRMQFNSGVRHIVPIVPFVFLLAAGVLLKMPRVLASLTGVAAIYWSWCLAQYRDVEQGFGIYEAVARITLEGFRLPWLATLERMGFVADASPLPIFLVCAALIWALWSAGSRRQTSYFQ